MTSVCRERLPASRRGVAEIAGLAFVEDQQDEVRAAAARALHGEFLAADGAGQADPALTTT